MPSFGEAEQSRPDKPIAAMMIARKGRRDFGRRAVGAVLLPVGEGAEGRDEVAMWREETAAVHRGCARGNGIPFLQHRKPYPSRPAPLLPMGA